MDVYTGNLVSGASAFKINSFPIQPALYASFPWLSASAENYQEYKINGLVYEFKSNAFNISNSLPGTGTVILATQYNVYDPLFTDKFHMEQTQYTCTDKPVRDIMHPIECARNDTPTSILCTRAGATSQGDLRLYDWGNFSIATVGMGHQPANIGELWVTYDITLYKPKVGSNVDVFDHWILNTPYVAPGGPAYFGTVSNPPALTSSSDMGTTITSSDGGSLDTVNWPPSYFGNVMLVYNCSLASVASSSLATPYTPIVSGGAAILQGFANGTYTNEGPGPLVYNANGGTTFVVILTINGGGYITFTGGTTAASLDSADLIVVALPSNFDVPSALLTDSDFVMDFKTRAPAPLVQRNEQKNKPPSRPIPSRK
jgi:hypothetical protein